MQRALIVTHNIFGERSTCLKDFQLLADSQEFFAFLQCNKLFKWGEEMIGPHSEVMPDSVLRHEN